MNQRNYNHRNNKRRKRFYRINKNNGNNKNRTQTNKTQTNKTQRQVREAPKKEETIQVKTKNVFEEMTCKPNCSFFPNMECQLWRTDRYGVKYRDDGKQFICGYDGHTIKSWYGECPKVKEGYKH